MHNTNNIQKIFLLTETSRKISLNIEIYALILILHFFARKWKSFMLSQNLRNYQVEKKPYYE